MTCKGFYEEQGTLMKNTLQKLTNELNLQKNISIYLYIGESNERYIDTLNNTIHVLSPDSMHYTYLKTIETLKFIDDKFNYDFIIRINTSEFINIKLLYELCKVIKNNNKLYAKTYSCSLVSFNNTYYTSFAPYAGYPVLQGKFLLFSKETVKTLLLNKYVLYNNDKYKLAGTFIDRINNEIWHIDDVCISSVLNIINFDKSFNEYLGTVYNIPSYNVFMNYDDIRQYLTICIKENGTKNLIQKEKISKLYELFIHNKNDNIIDVLNKNVKEMNDSSVYLGYDKNGHKYIKLNTYNNFK